jgi:hypothetical protein
MSPVRWPDYSEVSNKMAKYIFELGWHLADAVAARSMWMTRKDILSLLNVAQINLVIGNDGHPCETTRSTKSRPDKIGGEDWFRTNGPITGFNGRVELTPTFFKFLRGGGELLQCFAHVGFVYDQGRKKADDIVAGGNGEHALRAQ